MTGVQLDSVVTMIGGGTPSKNRPEYYANGTVPWVTPKDMKSWEITDTIDRITQDAIDGSATRLIPRDSVLLVVRSGILKHSLPIAINRVPVALNQDMKALVCDSAVLPEYLARFLQWSAPWILSQARATTADNLPVDGLRKLRVPLPPLPEQRRIAALLDKADAVRRKRQQAIRLADDLLRSAFLDMFGDPATNPKGWDTKHLGTLIKDGPQNGLYRHASDYGSGTPIVRIDSFADGQIRDLSALKRVRIDPETVALYRVAEDDILINRVNAPNLVGKSAIVPHLTEPTVFESNMMRLTVDPRVVLPEFLVAQLQTAYVRRQISRRTKDAVNQSSVNQDDVRSFEIRAPPLELQRRFLGVKRRAFTFTMHLRQDLQRCSALFDSLVQRGFPNDAVSAEPGDVGAMRTRAVERS